MSKQFLAFRCPQKLLDTINNQMVQRNSSRTDVILSMLQCSHSQSIPVANKSQLPEIAAIYFVATSSNKLLYIGQTENLKQCWQNHLFWSQFIEADIESKITWFELDEGASFPIIEPELLDSNTEIKSHNSSLHFVTTKQLNDAVNNLKDELLRDQSVTVSEVSSGVAINNEQIEALRSQIEQQMEQLRSHLSEFSINLNLPKDSSSEGQENEGQ